MKIISWNVNGIRAWYKKGLVDWLKTESPDVFCIQETKAWPEQLPSDLINIEGYLSFLSHAVTRKGYSGVAIYTKKKPDRVEYGMGIKKFDDEGRFLAIYLKNTVVITCYFPNGGMGPHRLKYKLEYYEAFLKHIKKLKKDGYNVIFCGDVNTAHNPIDLARPKPNEKNTGFLPIERAWIDKVIKNGFIDTFRHLHPETVEMYTYWDMKTRSRDRNVGWRIDYFFVNKEFLPKVKKSYMLSEVYGSDHCPIVLEIK